MEKSTLIAALKEQFAATFNDELIPGILHNFANPLNGIMGRVKLLSRRHEEVCRSLATRYPELVDDLPLEKITRDIDSIAKEADRFWSLFKDVAQKFTYLSSEAEESLNLSQLIAQEIRFGDFYLNFKHEVKKELLLDENLPEIKSSPAAYSLGFFALLMGIGKRLKDSPQKEISITTSHNDTHIIITVRDNAPPYPPIYGEILTTKGEIGFSPQDYEEGPLMLALLLFRKMGVFGEVLSVDGKNEITLFVPYR